MMKNSIALSLVFAASVFAQPDLETGFKTPEPDARPETWFHLIGGNVSKQGLTRDLESVAGAGIKGIQLFHGNGRAWEGVSPQIACLSEEWDGMIAHVADETKRLDLNFTMQNCPGWAMSGGPWITPDKAMRHIISGRTDIEGGKAVSTDLPQPQPSGEDWRNYQDIAVLAFPTPLDDTGKFLQPVSAKSSDSSEKWGELLKGKGEPLILVPGKKPSWLDVEFETETVLRSIELPPVETLTMRKNFDPRSEIVIKVPEGNGWRELVTHKVPRSSWQDRQSEYPWVLALPDFPSKKYRLEFRNRNRLSINYLRFSSAARPQDWRGQAGFALRSLERIPPPQQDANSWVKLESVIDLSEKMDAKGRLQWDAPAGRWTVLRFGHVNTGVKNKPAPPEATGFECDKLSPAGAEQHFAGYIGRISAPGGPADGGRLKGMLIDSWECYTQTWTPAMEGEFEKLRAYKLRQWLPALAGWVMDDPRKTEQFYRDWRATISDLTVKNYFGRLAELGRERGLKLSFETAAGDVPTGDILEYYKNADIPMCEFWQPNDPRNGGLEAKPIAPTVSAAHIYGKTRIAAEAFTEAPVNWKEHPFALKHHADRNFAKGVTHLVFHTYTHNPVENQPGTTFGGAIGTPFLRGQTWWKHMPLFTDYLARCQFMLEQGKPVADVLWYLGDDIDARPRQDDPFPDGYQFDYLNADVLINRLNVTEDGSLTIPEGNTWRVLWLPRDRCERLAPASLEKIKALVEAGATVIGHAPSVNPTLSGHEKDFTSLVSGLWGENPSEKGDLRLGKGRLLWGEELGKALGALGIPADVEGAGSAAWIHRKTEREDIYFIAADRLTPLNANFRFRVREQRNFGIRSPVKPRLSGFPQSTKAEPAYPSGSLPPARFSSFSVKGIQTHDSTKSPLMAHQFWMRRKLQKTKQAPTHTSDCPETCPSNHGWNRRSWT